MKILRTMALVFGLSVAAEMATAVTIDFESMATGTYSALAFADGTITYTGGDHAVRCGQRVSRTSRERPCAASAITPTPAPRLFAWISRSRTSRSSRSGLVTTIKTTTTPICAVYDASGNLLGSDYYLNPSSTTFGGDYPQRRDLDAHRLRALLGCRAVPGRRLLGQHDLHRRGPRSRARVPRAAGVGAGASGGPPAAHQAVVVPRGRRTIPSAVALAFALGGSPRRATCLLRERRGSLPTQMEHACRHQRRQRESGPRDSCATPWSSASGRSSPRLPTPARPR